jgi:hypothetical protein
MTVETVGRRAHSSGAPGSKLATDLDLDKTMMTRTPVSDETRLPDEVARRLIDRAIALDAARKSSVSVGELRELAHELGLAPESLDDALRELTTLELRAPLEPALTLPRAIRSLVDRFNAWVTRYWRWIRPTIVGLGGLELGVIARELDRVNGATSDLHVTLDVTVAVGVASLLLALYHRGRRRAGDYQRDLVVLWGTFGAGWSLANGGVVEGIALLALASWLGLSGIGALIVSWPSDRATDENVEPSAASPRTAAR